MTSSGLDSNISHCGSRNDANRNFILAAYFFVLIVLAVYGWHRYYLVYLYMKYRDNGPRRAAALDPARL